METLGPRFGTFSWVDDNDLFCDLQAHTLTQDTARHPRHWGWTLWEGRVKVGLFFSSYFFAFVLRMKMETFIRLGGLLRRY